MSHELVGVLGFAALLVLLALRIPVGIAMMAVSAGGLALVLNPQAALDRFGPDAFNAASVQSLSVIPVFIMMGLVLAQADLGKDIYDLFDSLLRRLKGRLAIATIAAGALFGSVNGSAMASASTLSVVAIPEMRRHGYADNLSSGTVAVAGTLGMLIPPSAVLIFYGILTEESISELLIASLVPGILVVILLILTTMVLVRRHPEWAPAYRSDDAPSLATAVMKAWPAPLLFAITMGGIYSGVFTPNEAGGVGVALSVIYGLTSRRLSPRKLVTAVSQTVNLSSAIFLIVIGGKMFGFFIAFTGVPGALSDWVAELAVPAFLAMLLIFAVYFVLGALMDELAILVIMTPIMYPVVIELGFSGVWFGVASIMMLLTGLLMPPVGIVSFVVAGVSGIPLRTVFRGILPYQVPLAISFVIVTAFPSVVLFLPELMG